ncbi:MAG: crossover junction endodeoxyribonuclease RuvC [Bdellovibrionaceae bacterium]|nr:crossover junction endodeoxyribonuclease RuvC [Pseudobdellovibrionaceae bacterium]
MRILGIDPGSRLTGFGCVDSIGNRLKYVNSGTLELNKDKKTSLEKRLFILDQSLEKVISKLEPDILVVEKVFFAKNAVSALKLGQARGVAIVCGIRNGLSFFEYNPTEIKQSVVGHGRADKAQVAEMVKMLTGVNEFATADESDALAIAICHAHHHGMNVLPETLKALKKTPKDSKKRNSLSGAVRHLLKD